MSSVDNFFEPTGGRNNTFNLGGHSKIDGVRFTAAEFRHILQNSAYDRLVLVNDVSDFPDPVNGIITLEDDKAYLIDGDINIGENRIVCGANNAIWGLSAEISYLHNTLAGQPMITANRTLNCYFVTFYVSGSGASCLNLDATASPVANNAIDWAFVNFSGGDVGTITGYSNAIFETIGTIDKTDIGLPALGNSFVFDGNMDSVVFTNSLLTASGSGNSAVTLSATLTLSRRFRATNCAIVAVNSAVGLDFVSGATVPSEGVILSNTNLSGNGTLLSGIDFQNDEARFDGCRGIQNTYAAAQFSMLGNATATVINTVGVAEKVAGTTTLSTESNLFEQVSNNEIRYIGALSRLADITFTASLSAGNNNRIGLYVAKNDTPIDISENYETTDSGGRLSNISAQLLTAVEFGDTFSAYVENDTSTSNVTVENLNGKIRAFQ